MVRLYCCFPSSIAGWDGTKGMNGTTDGSKCKASSRAGNNPGVKAGLALKGG